MRGRTIAHFMFPVLAAIACAMIGAPTSTAQSQAIDGQIEGTVYDQDRRAVVGVELVAQNTETGLARRAHTNTYGRFRFLLLSPGSYSLTGRAVGFKRWLQHRVTVATGQTVVIDPVLQIGSFTESVDVSDDAPVADAGEIEHGRVMRSTEVQNVPLVTLNPYNFVFLQSNVTGNRTAAPGLGFPNVHANGFSRRGSYQVDGNYATDVMTGGVRMLFLARPFIQEVQLLTSGMSAEYGSTVGHVMNVVTPSGSNLFRGNAGYQFRRRGFSAHRFNVSPNEPRGREPIADVFTMAGGGPIVADRWHYFAGLEAFKWDLASAARTITISDANRTALVAAGVPESAMIASYPAPETYQFFIGRTDIGLNDANRLSLRYLHTSGRSDKIGGTQLNTLQLTRDNLLLHRAFAFHLVSNRGATIFNEFRGQLSRRDNTSEPNEHTGRGNVTIRIPNVATFGAPPDSRSNFENRLLAAVHNSLSVLIGTHALKIGGGFAAHNSRQPSQPSAEYRFSSVQRYVDAVTGVNRRSYTRYTDTFGAPGAETDAVFWSAFVQDDWRVNRRLKINAGIRYDLFLLPEADQSTAAFPSKEFTIDRNNFGPRLGIAYLVHGGRLPAVIRASAGLYYDPPILNYYLRALRSANPRSFSFSFGPVATSTIQAGPEFPMRFDSFPIGQPAPVRVVETIAQDFKTMTAFHSNVQFEKALLSDLAFTGSYSFSKGWHIPTSRNINCGRTTRTLADGRPVYGETFVDPAGNATVIPCVNRIVPSYSAVWRMESVGTLTYHAATFKLAKRLSPNLQFSVNYTISRSADDAPEENITAVAQVQSDPADRRIERAVSLSDQTHTLAASLIARPTFTISQPLLNYVANNNQVAIIIRASDGERYNIVADTDLNGDGGFMDRPVGIRRNALKTPAFFMLDIRASRTFNLSDRHRLEAFADVSNLTNTNSVIGFSSTVISANNVNTALVNPFSGELRGPLPDFRSGGVVSTDSRRLQLGLRLFF